MRQRPPMDIICEIIQTILTKVSNARDIKKLSSQLAPVAVRFDLDGTTYRVGATMLVEEIQGNIALGSNNAMLMQDILRGDAVDYERVDVVINSLVNTATHDQLRGMAEGMGWPDLETKQVLKRIFRAYLEKAVNVDQPEHHSCREALDMVWLHFGSAARQRLATAMAKQFGFEYAKDVDHYA